MTVRRTDTSVDIDAQPQIVWKVLTDFAAYPEWNPFIRRIEGKISKEARLSVSIQPHGQKTMLFRPKMKAAESQVKFSWLGHLLIRGIFDGHHQFELHSKGNGTHLRHFESFSGLLVPLIWNKIEPSTRAGFEAMNQALKVRAETLARKA
jgi:hypothetical protein